jgi:hypothetical protein
MATTTKAGGDGATLPPAPFEDAHQRADLARIADDLHALNARYAIDPEVEVGVLADGTIRFWCFAKYGRAFRLSLREGKRGAKPIYRETDEWFPTFRAAEAEVGRRNDRAVRRA